MRKKINIVVTGAAGFIGSHLSKKLESLGYNLTLLDDFSRGKQKYLDWLKVKTECHKCDLTDYSNASAFLENADVVFHTASRIGGNQYLHGSPLNELKAFQENSLIDTNVFKACLQHNIKKIIYTSSVSIYNTKKQQEPRAVISENDFYSYPLDPEGGYGWAKYMAEKQLEWLSFKRTKVGIARIFKSYGPCDDYSEESGQVVCSLMRKAYNYPKEKYTVWGDGSASRCLVYINDLVDALIRIKKYLTTESITVNIGGNKPIPIKELSSKIIEVANKDIKIKYDLSKPVGVRSRIPILTRAKDKLNWEPKTTLEKGLKVTWEWMREELK